MNSACVRIVKVCIPSKENGGIGYNARIVIRKLKMDFITTMNQMFVTNKKAWKIYRLFLIQSPFFKKKAVEEAKLTKGEDLGMKMVNVIYLIFLSLILITGCTNPYPETQIISEEPLIIGYITEINEEKQVIQVVENISKEEALNGITKDNGSWVQINGVTIDGWFEVGNKVAIWDSPSSESASESERKVMPLGKNIVLLEK
jgi:hypothetical protein